MPLKNTKSSKKLFKSKQCRERGELENIIGWTPYPLTSRIRCSECGSFYRRKVRSGGIKWVCATHEENTKACDSFYYSEERIYDGFLSMVNKLRFGQENILGQVISKLETATALYKKNNQTAMQIFNMYLAGSTLDQISETIIAMNPTFKDKKFSFTKPMIKGILQNEKYCGDCILQKTVTLDPIEKTRKPNEGEAPMWLVENAHDPIVSRETFNRVQEEMSRRKTYSPQSKKTALTASGKYSRYALSDVLQCGECGTRYKRVTWNIRGKKKIVWRCVSRLDYGKKFCPDSITVEEQALQKNNRKGIKEIQRRRRSHIPHADAIHHRRCHRTQRWLG